MYRNKLEYMTKNLPMNQKGNITVEIDTNGEYMFDFLTKEKYRKQFEKINNLCIENKIQPFF